MSYKFKHGTDGTRRLVDNTSGNVAQVYYPTAGDTGGRQRILRAATTLSHEDNGSIFYLNAATEFATTLPAPFLGAEFEFIVAAAPSGASYTIVTGASANIIVGHVVSSDLDATSDADSETTGGDTISFADGKAVAGDRVVLRSDGTKWYAWGSSKAVDGITISTATT